MARKSSAKRIGASCFAGVLVSALLAIPGSASAMQLIEILDIGDSDVTMDGTIFSADPNPSEPATGTGVFEPFVRTQANGQSWAGGDQQLGMNSDTKENDVNFDTKGGSDWTRSITLGEVGIVEIDGVTYYEFLLDANEEGRAGSEANKIILDDVQIYVDPSDIFANPEMSGTGVDGTGYTGEVFNSADNSMLGEEPVWSLDSVENGDVTVLLQASICGSRGQCGSGHGDLAMYIPTDLIEGSPDDYLVFYVEYSKAGGPSGGFEEWSTRASDGVIPEPSAALVFSLGMLVTGARVRRIRR